MRLEKLFLKMFQVEPRVPVRMLLDCSNSMTTGAVSKFDYARKLAAALVLRRPGAAGYHLHPALRRTSWAIRFCAAAAGTGSFPP